MGIDKRLTALIELLGLSPAEFADKISVQRSGISHITSGRNKPSLYFLENTLNTFPDINAEWLILGKGKPFKSQTKSQPEEKKIETSQINESTETNLFAQNIENVEAPHKIESILFSADTNNTNNNIPDSKSTENRNGKNSVKLESTNLETQNLKTEKLSVDKNLAKENDPHNSFIKNIKSDSFTNSDISKNIDIKKFQQTNEFSTSEEIHNLYTPAMNIVDNLNGMNKEAHLKDSDQIRKDKKEVKKIMILYKDGSFEIYDNE